MKKLLLLIATLTTMTAKSQTAVYHPFPDSSAIWNFHYVSYCFPLGTIDNYYSITVSGDTVINSQTYHKLNTPYVQDFSTGTCGGGIPNGYKGAIRQDTTNKKVFYVPPSGSMEELLYDFNMQVGDTVKGFLESMAFPKDTIQSIDSVLVGNDYRKRWNINPCYYIYFIEGIGSTFGLISLSPGCQPDWGEYSLTCFTQNGMTLYPDTNINCELITYVKNIYSEKYLQIIFPNPFINELTVKTNSNELSEIIIYDITSRKILQQIFTNSVLLNTQQLAKGIYIYEVINKKGAIEKGKVVKD
ncbi:MAG TPA: T9SS type A sorting domain-containing protein [Bacteroidia bacterium]|nr:T9SS type A sorting domain-containing protein [Bacteroidia bacterium]